MRKRRGALAIAAILAAAVAQPALSAVIPFVADGDKDIGLPPTDPVTPGSYSVSGTTHTIAGGGADWWDNAERGHIAYKAMSGDAWRIETGIGVLPLGDLAAADYDYWLKAGPFIRNDVNVGGAGDEREVNAIMAALRKDRNQSSFQWRPNANDNWMGNSDSTGTAPPQKLAIQKRLIGSIPVVDGFVSYDGTTWTHVGTTLMPNLSATPYAGLAVTAHRNEAGHLLTAEFYNPVISDEIVVPAAAAMRPVSATLPKPAAGMWGIREVFNAGNNNNLTDTVSHLNNPGSGVVLDYQRPWINIRDSDSHGRFAAYGPKNQFEAVNAGQKNYGSVDHIAMAMNGTINVPTSGWYTFNVNSDDGFEFAIDGEVVMEANYGKGAGDVLGYKQLTAGQHAVRVLYWEGGGGASVEVMAAPGTKTSFDNTFRLIGAPEVTIPGIKNVTVGQTPPTADGPDNRDQALAALQTAIANQTIIARPADRVNHADPSAGGGFFGDKRPFPIDDPTSNGVDDNNFAFGAQGKIVIPKDGTWYLGYQSDDGAALQIVGRSWDGVVENLTGAGVIEGDWLKSDVWTGDSWTVGKITLPAGEYDFTFVSYEGGGGAYATLFGSDTQGFYEVLQGDARTISAGLELVPEPSAMLLLALGGLGLASRRRRA